MCPLGGNHTGSGSDLCLMQEVDNIVGKIVFMGNSYVCNYKFVLKIDEMKIKF